MLPAMSSRPALRRLIGEFRPYRGTIAIVIGLGLVISSIQPASVKLTQLIIDYFQLSKVQPFPTWLPLVLVLLFVVSGAAKYLYNVIRRTLCEKVLVRFREALFDRYLHFPLEHIDRSRTGEMLSGIQNDLQQLNSGFDTLWDLVKEPFTFLGLIGAAIYFDWQLALITLTVAPLVIGIFSWSGAAVKRYSARNMGQYSDLVSLCQEVLVGSRIVKVFGLEDVLGAKFRAIQTKYFETALKSIRTQELSTPMVELIGAAIMAGVIVYGGQQASAGTMTAGDLIGFIISLGLAQMPIKQLNNAHLKLRNAEAAAERIYKMLDAKMARTGVTASRPLFRHSIVYENVGLSYGHHAALQSISFEVKAGEHLALVGQSGGGKTSIVNLLPRLYEATSGRIFIDGKDTRSMPLAELRSLMSYVTQDVFLFHDTILENVRYGSPSASRAEIERALVQAHCMDFIQRLPNGLETIVGDRGMRLSGGERQRIAIARAFLKGAPILLLDEATSSLDSDSERIVQQALDELMDGKTALIVAHRFSTIRQADRILVIEAGHVRQQGTHDALVEISGIYRGLFQQQVWEAPL